MTKTRFAKLLASRQQQQQQTAILLQELAARAHASKVLAIAAEHNIPAADAAAFIRDMESEKMVATKKVVEAVESTSVELAEPVTPESIDAMKAQQKELAARIKAMKAALPKKSSLESVLEKQSNGVTDKRSRQYFAGLVRSRIKAGQDRETALSAVVEMFTDFLMAEIAKE